MAVMLITAMRLMMVSETVRTMVVYGIDADGNEGDRGVDVDDADHDNVDGGDGVEDEGEDGGGNADGDADDDGEEHGVGEDGDAGGDGDDDGEDVDDDDEGGQAGTNNKRTTCRHRVEQCRTLVGGGGNLTRHGRRQCCVCVGASAAVR